MGLVVAAICRSISPVYAKLLNYGLAPAEAFRHMMIVALLDPESPVFKVSPGDTVGNATDISIVIPGPRKDRERSDRMTRNQRKQLRRGVLYLCLLAALCLLLIAGLTT